MGSPPVQGIEEWNQEQEGTEKEAEFRKGEDIEQRRKDNDENNLKF